MASKRGKGSKDTPAPSQVTHARPAGGGDSVGQSGVSATKDQRIAHIERMMAENVWRTGVTGPELAAEWGVSLKTVEGYSAEASRRIRNEFDPDERRKLKHLWLAKVNEAQRACVGRGDMNALRGMFDLEARALGYYEPEKYEVSGAVDVSAKTALERKLDELGKRIAGSAAQPG